MAECCRRQGLRLVVAESCTGGWIGKLCSDLAGSSRWFEASIVTYSDAAKSALLGISTDTLLRHGAVSSGVVLEMATGALERVATANVSIAVSGVAGPGSAIGRTLPPGSVWIAWCRRGDMPSARRFHFEGERSDVRFSAARAALAGLTGLLEQGGI